jgi:hypothetical protein
MRSVVTLVAAGPEWNVGACFLVSVAVPVWPVWPFFSCFLKGFQDHAGMNQFYKFGGDVSSGTSGTDLPSCSWSERRKT